MTKLTIDNARYVLFKTGEPWDYEDDKYNRLAKAVEEGAKLRTRKEHEADKMKWHRKQLKKLVKPNQTVYTVLEHVSKNGMTRHIRVVVGTQKGREIVDITYRVAKLCGYRLKGGALVVSGCGMDMGFSVVYDLGKQLWPNGTASPHGTRNGEPDSDGGYAIKHRWL